MLTASAAAPAQWRYACGYVTHLAASGLVRSAALVEYARWSSQLDRDASVVGHRGGTTASASAVHPPVAVRRWESPASLQRRLYGCAAVVRAAAVSPPRPGTLRVVFLDVGQGDSTLVEFAGRRTFLLVDAGGVPGTGFDIGERVVLPALLRVRCALDRHAGADAWRSRSHRRSAGCASAFLATDSMGRRAGAAACWFARSRSARAARLARPGEPCRPRPRADREALRFVSCTLRFRTGSASACGTKIRSCSRFASVTFRSCCQAISAVRRSR